jgi:quercetin dioxygenase-like cupin family protein
MDTLSKRFFYDSGSKWEEVWPGITRKIVGYDDRLMLVKVLFEKGAEAPAHDHPHSQSSYIESGIFEVTLGDEKMVLSAGDGFNVLPDLKHSVIAMEAGIIIDAFSPKREDFLS